MNVNKKIVTDTCLVREMTVHHFATFSWWLASEERGSHRMEEALISRKILEAA